MLTCATDSLRPEPFPSCLEYPAEIPMWLLEFYLSSNLRCILVNEIIVSGLL